MSVGRILCGYRNLGRVTPYAYNRIFSNNQNRIWKSLRHIREFSLSSTGEFSTTIYLGRGVSNDPSYRGLKEGFYTRNLHPALVATVLTTIDASMIDMYNNLEEIESVHLHRIQSIVDVPVFMRASRQGRMRIIRDLNIIRVRMVTADERMQRESERREDALRLMGEHNPSFRQREMFEDHDGLVSVASRLPAGWGELTGVDIESLPKERPTEESSVRQPLQLSFLDPEKD